MHRGGLASPRWPLFACRVWRVRPRLGWLALLAAAPLAAQTPPGTSIVNQASVSFVDLSGTPAVSFSNQVDLVTERRRSSAEIMLTRVVSATGSFAETTGPAACFDGTDFVPLPDPKSLAGVALDSAAVHQLMPASVYYANEALFVRVTDFDQNHDAGTRETVTVTFRARSSLDVERIRLTETTPDSGVFAGYLPSSALTGADADCQLQAARNSYFDVEYVDSADPDDTVATAALFDPISRVFDAQSGLPVDGVAVTLLDALTGQPATVFGADGVSAFPASVRSGEPVSDASGASYVAAPGEFRFPIVPEGEYRLQVEPPQGYRAPSQRGAAELQGLAGAPFSIDPGSYGQQFSVGPSRLLNLDIPLDPSLGTLYLDKRVLASNASVGDFVEYRLRLSHTGGNQAAEAVVIEDRLPMGLKFQSGSARSADIGNLDVALSEDGRVLRFAVGTLAPDTSIDLRYVAAVVPGSSDRELVNTARAIAGDGGSNEARATLRIVDDLFSNESFLAGRVMLGACTEPGLGEDAGLAGARVYLEDGRFAVADEGGRFHFEGLQPGTHSLQIDLESLPGGFEVEPCPQDSRFAGTGFSQFVTLRPGALGRADFYLRRVPPPSGILTVELAQRLASPKATAGVTYRLDIGTPDDIQTGAVQVMVMLPDGLTYLADSARSDLGHAMTTRIHGNVLTFELGDRAGPWQETLQFAAEPRADAAGELRTQALARFSFDGEMRQTARAETALGLTPGRLVGREYVLALNFETLSASLAAADRAALDALIADWRGIANLSIEAVGHSDAVPISPQSRSVYTDNYALSAARAAAVGDYVQSALGVGAAQLSVQGLGPDRPVADNRTAAGRRANRRVELKITGIAVAEDRKVESLQAESGPRAIELIARVEPLPPMTMPAELEVAPRDNGQTVPDFDLTQALPGTEWLWPPAQFSPPIPTSKVVVKHAADERVQLWLNGTPVSALNFEGLQVSAERDVAISRWRGIDLQDGPNRFEARVLSGSNQAERAVLERAVHFAGGPVHAELVESRSALVADGKTRPALALRFVDRWGQPARSGSAARFSIDAPYRSWWDIERLRENSVLMSGDRAPTLTVGAEGIALIELEPTTLTGQVTLTVQYANEGEQELRAWLKPEMRDWILVGLAEGTLGHATVQGHMETAAAAGLDADYYNDGRLAFYAKGRVKGSVLTLAFDTDGEREGELDAFGGAIDPDRYYTLYGDNTEQRFDAPSRERLYLKIERDAFVALVGDYETGLTITDLARYSRSLTGFKSEHHGEHVSYSAFAASTDQSFIKDELRGNGTSGPYRLSRQLILPGSDKLRVEARDRFKPDRIVATRSLQRHFDYDIDYRNGSIYFREPIATRDFDFNPVYIVVDYESADKMDASLLVGGRAAAHFGAHDSEVGVTLIREGTTGAPGELAGTDLRYRFSDATELKTELAVSDVERPGSGAARGSAYLIELEHQTGQRQIEAYWRETSADFGLGQQPATEPGTRRAGVALRNEIGTTWLVEADLFKQRNLLDGAKRTVLEGQTRYQDTRRTGQVGVRRVDEQIGAQDNTSSQAFVGGTWRFFDEVLTTRVNLETELSGTSSSVDYPTRTLMGVDVAVGPRVTLFGEHEVAEGERVETQMTRFGVKANPTQRSQIETSFNDAMTEYGPRSFASFGMMQGFSVGEHWTLDVGLERSELLERPGLTAFDARVPLASGGEDFSTGFLGLGFRAPHWSFSTRFEYRDSELDSQRGLIGGFYRERNSGRGFSAELRLLERSVGIEPGAFDGNLRLGWAYRPAASRWMVFARSDWVSERQLLGDGTARSQRLVNNFNAHFKPNHRQQLSLQYAFKLVRSRLDDFRARGMVSLFGLDWRRQLNRKLDIGWHASWYGAPDLNVEQRGWGIDLGVGLSRNLMVTAGYNFTGFEDRDFTRARYTAKGPFVQFRLKVDQASLRDLLRR